jgi:two-component system, OmpR family, sensor histidine kinase KdpD
MDNRPNPDEILKKIQEEEENNDLPKKGRLKIFLGFCAGVGKTYHMLEETQVAVKSGINAVIGIVETHKRKETEALLEGLEIIPRKKIEYNGISLDEMDIDKILELKPKLVVVDELAHTNIPGSRHEKRYQDVEELISAGINVFTTLNIQHIESLIDVVQQISYVTIHETVPDSILELADEIELIDLTPEKLLERLHEGKVYIPEKARQAMQKFFRKGNLLALRELSLRYTAKRVDEDMLSYKQRYAITTPWPVDSKLLVGFSASPTSERLLRITHRMASDMNAEWYAVYVESPQQVEIDEKARNQLDKNIRLAEELGAKVASLSGNVIADAIINFAKEKNINLIVAGLSHRSRIEEIFKGSVLNDLTKKSGQINVLIVGNDNNKTIFEKHLKVDKTDYKPYLISTLSILAIILFGWLTRSWLEPFNIGMLLLLPVIASSIFWGTRIGLFTSVIAVLTFDFFLIPPFLTFRISDIKYLPSFFVFIIISLIVSLLAKGIRWQTESTRHRERFLASLYSFSREIMSARNLDEILNKAASHISEAFQSNLVILLPDENNQLQVTKKQGGLEFNEKEKAVAVWVYKNGLQAGRNTQTLSSAKWHYLPLKAEEITFGVLGFTPTEQDRFLSSEQQRLLESFANIIAMYLKRK